jgi:putative nucleotidyltransferase with HDIG domain
LIPFESLTWDELDSRYDWIRAMRGTQQDPVHHAEGDVWIHTRMVLDSLRALETFRGLSPEERRVAFAGALMHDVGKPHTTRTDDAGRTTSLGHSTHGATLARQILWRMGMPFRERERVVALVRHHQAPFWLLEREDPRALVIRIAETARCDLLALVSEADARGRTCADQPRILENIDLFRVACEEEGVLRRSFPFPSAHARFQFFSGAQRDPTYAPHESFACEVVLMSGFPGAGKDRWIAENVASSPVVSLDRIRTELGVDPADDQGTVVSRAREEARAHLRAGRSFVWNATNVSKRIRAQCIRIFSDYGARVRIVWVEAPEETLRTQNRSRAKPVPEAVLDTLIDKWELPDTTEAHDVTYVTRE